MTSPTVRAGTNGNGNSAASTSLVVNIPSGTQTGDTLLLYCYQPQSGVTWTAPGFTTHTAISGSGSSGMLLTRTADGTEGSTLTITSSASSINTAIIAAYPVLTGSAFDVTPTSGVYNGLSVNIKSNGLTTVTVNDTLVFFAGTNAVVNGGAPQTVTIPAGMTAQVAQVNGTATGSAVNPGMVMCDAVQVTPGAVAAKQGSVASQTFSTGVLIALQGVPPQPPPSLHKAGGNRLRRFAVVKHQGRIFHPTYGQGFQGLRFPLMTRPAGSRPRWDPYIRRGKSFIPVPPQATQGVQFPLFTRQAGIHPRWNPYIRRGKITVPMPPQASQGIRFPLFTRGQAGAHPHFAPRLRRTHYFMQPMIQGAQGIAWNLFTRQKGRFPKWEPPRRMLKGRQFGPVLPQSPQQKPFPMLFRQKQSILKMIRIARPLPRGFRQFLFTAQTVHAQASLSAHSSVTVAGLITHPGTVHMSAASSMTVSPVVTRRGTVSMTAASSMKVTGAVTRAGHVSMSAASSLTAHGVVTRNAAASFSAASSMTVTATDTPGVRMSAASSMTVASGNTVLASASLNAASSLTVAPQVTRPVQEIIVEGNEIDPRDKVVRDGTWSQFGPEPGPAVISTGGLITGVYDDQD